MQSASSQRARTPGHSRNRRYHAAPRAMTPGHSPRTTVSPDESDTNAHAETNAAPRRRRARPTVAPEEVGSCFSVPPSPCRPDQRAESTPACRSEHRRQDRNHLPHKAIRSPESRRAPWPGRSPRTSRRFRGPREKVGDVGQRDQFQSRYARAVEHPQKLGQLLRISAGDQNPGQLPKAFFGAGPSGNTPGYGASSASRCSANNVSHAASAASSSLSSVDRGKVAPSPVPCTSTKGAGVGGDDVHVDLGARVLFIRADRRVHGRRPRRH